MIRHLTHCEDDMSRLEILDLMLRLVVPGLPLGSSSTAAASASSSPKSRTTNAMDATVTNSLATAERQAKSFVKALASKDEWGGFPVVVVPTVNISQPTTPRADAEGGAGGMGVGGAQSRSASVEPTPSSGLGGVGDGMGSEPSSPSPLSPLAATSVDVDTATDAGGAAKREPNVGAHAQSQSQARSPQSPPSMASKADGVPSQMPLPFPPSVTANNTHNMGDQGPGGAGGWGAFGASNRTNSGIMLVARLMAKE